jgi:translation elongation factor EF-G
MRLFRKEATDKAMERYCFKNDMDRELLVVNKVVALEILKIYFSPVEEVVKSVDNSPIFFEDRNKTETLGEFKGSYFKKKNEKKDTNKFGKRNSK